MFRCKAHEILRNEAYLCSTLAWPPCPSSARELSQAMTEDAAQRSR